MADTSSFDTLKRQAVARAADAQADPFVAEKAAAISRAREADAAFGAQREAAVEKAKIFAKFTPDNLDALANEDPLGYYNQFKGELTAEQEDTLAKAHQLKNSRFTTQDAKNVVTGTGGLIKDLAIGAVDLGKRVLTGSNKTGAITIGKNIAGGSEPMTDSEELKNIQEGVEGGIVAESALSRIGDMFRKGVRRAAQGNFPGSPEWLMRQTGIIPEDAPVPTADILHPETFAKPEDYKARFFADAAQREQMEKINKGEGAVMKAFEKAFDLTPEQLTKMGVKIDAEAMAREAGVLDPSNAIPFGKGFALVGNGGKLLATAATREALVNLANRVGQKVTSGAGKAEAVLKTFNKGRAGLAGTIVGTAADGVSGGLAGTVAGMTAPALARVGATAVRKVGERLQNTAATRPALGFLLNTADAGLQAGAIGAGFAAGTDSPAEAVQTIAGAGALGVAGHTAGSALMGAARKGANSLAAGHWNAELAGGKPTADVPAYGVDQTLDAAHNGVMADARQNNSGQANILARFRNLFTKVGAEIYGMTPEQYAAEIKKSGLDAAGTKAAETEGVTITMGPDGKQRVLLRYTPEKGFEALGHEVGHLFDRIAPDELKSQLDAEGFNRLTVEGKQAAWDYYREKLGDEKNYTPEQAKAALAHELRADLIGAILNNAPLDAVPEGMFRKAEGAILNFLESTGIYDPSADAAALATPFFDLGVSTDTARAIESFVRGEFRTAKGKVGEAPPAIPKPEAPSAGVAESPQRKLTREIIEKRDRGEKLSPEDEQFLQDLVDSGATNAPHVIAERIAFQKKLNAGEQLTPEEMQRNTKYLEAQRRLAKLGETPVPPVIPEAPKPEAPAAVPPVIPKPTITGESVRGTTEKTAGERFVGAARGEAVARVSAAAAKIASDPSLTPEQKAANKVLIDNVGKPVSVVYDAAVEAGSKNAADYQQRRQEVEAARSNPDLREAAPKFGIILKDSTIQNDGSVAHVVFNGDAVVVNMDRMLKAGDAAKKLIPYKFDAAGKLEDGGAQMAQDVIDYTNNQNNGYKGDGGKLNRPAGGTGFLPDVNPNYTPVTIPADRAAFANLLMGERPPLTARKPAKGTVPVPVRANRIAKANAKAGEPTGLEYKAGEFAGEQINEYNPLRSQMVKAGFDFSKLNPVSERIQANRIMQAEPTTGNLAPNVSDLTAAGFMPGKNREPNQTARANEEGYMKKAGLSGKPFTGYAPLDEKMGKEVADFYEKAQDNPNDPAVKAAYDAFAKETKAQWDYLTAQGVKMEPWTGEGQPYADSAAMRKDVADNNHLWFFPTEAGYGMSAEATPHPLLADAGVEVNGKKLVVNDLFRAVHDYFGHAKEGYEFGPRGELNAFLAHSRMFSEAANPAMAAETMGQNSWVNFGKHLRSPDGAIPKKGEPGYVPVTERPYAEQKAIKFDFNLDSIKNADFMPAKTKAGKEWEDGGFIFIRQTPEKGVTLLRLVDPDSNAELGFIKYAREGKESKVMMTAVPEEVKKKGIGETLYREMLTHLRDEGATSIEGDVVHPAPLRIREKLLGKPELISEGDYIGDRNVTGVRNEIRPDMQFQPRKGVEGATMAERAKPTEGAAKESYDALVARFKAATGAEKFKLWQEVEALKNATGGEKPATGAGEKPATGGDAVFQPRKKSEDYKPKNGNGWLLPDGSFEDIEGAYHINVLRKNVKAWNKKHGLNLPEDYQPEYSDAFNSGLARVRDTGGSATVEIPQSTWESQKKNVAKLFDAMTKRNDGITYYNIRITDEFGHTVANSDSVRADESTNPSDAIREAIEGVKIAEEVAEKPEPSLIQRARAFTVDPDADFMPKRDDQLEVLRARSRQEGQGASSAQRPQTVQDRLASWSERAMDAIDEIVNPPRSLEDLKKEGEKLRGEFMPKKATGWILPNGKYEPIPENLHEQNLAVNAKAYNEKYGTKFTDKVNEGERSKALDAGFVRIRQTPNGDTTVEVNAKFWDKHKKAIKKQLEASEATMNGLTIRVSNDKGRAVAEAEGNIFLGDDIGDIVSDIKIPAGKVTAKEPTLIQRARALPDATFMPKARGQQEMNLESVLGLLRTRNDSLTGRETVITSDNPISNMQEEVQKRNPAPDARAALAYFAKKEGVRKLKPGTVETDRQLAVDTEGKKFAFADQKVLDLMRFPPELFADETKGLPPEVVSALERLREAIPVLTEEQRRAIENSPNIGGGSEATVYKVGDAVYKVLDDESRPGFRMNPPEEGPGGGVGIRADRGGIVDMITRVARANKFEGAVPTEFVGFTADGRLIVKQPFLPEKATPQDVKQWEQMFGHRAPAQTEMTGDSIRFNRRSVDNQPILKDPFGNSYLTLDARDLNFRKTADGDVYATDIVIRPVTDADAAAVPALERFAPRDVEQMRFMPPKQEEMSLFKRRNKSEQRADFGEAVVPRDIDSTVPSDILGSPRYKEAKNHEAAVKSFKRELVKKYKRYADLPETKLGERWYEDFTPLLKDYFGDDAQVFAELLAATSPQMNPAQNFDSALEAYRRYKIGDYDKILTKFNEGLDNIASGEALPEYLKDRKAALAEGAPAKLWSEEPTPEGLTGWWIHKHNLLPKKEARYDAKGRNVVESKFGHSSRAVLWVIARKWFNENRGPKTRQFVKNLLGEDHGATIDLWADRTMREAGYKGYNDRWRILPENAEGVSNADFDFSQEVFKAAADELGLKPSALQGALWFIEKKKWAENGWSPLDLGSFITEIKRLKAYHPVKESLLQPRQKVVENATFDFGEPAPKQKGKVTLEAKPKKK